MLRRRKYLPLKFKKALCAHEKNKIPFLDMLLYIFWLVGKDSTSYITTDRRGWWNGQATGQFFVWRGFLFILPFCGSLALCTPSPGMGIPAYLLLPHPPNLCCHVCMVRTFKTVALSAHDIKQAWQLSFFLGFAVGWFEAMETCAFILPAFLCTFSSVLWCFCVCTHACLPSSIILCVCH